MTTTQTLLCPVSLKSSLRVQQVCKEGINHLTFPLIILRCRICTFILIISRSRLLDEKKKKYSHEYNA